MIIRDMTIEDVFAVAAIERACFSQPWSEQGFMDAVSGPDAHFLTAVENGEIAGYLGMYVSFDEGEITNVAVEHNFRGRGIGHALVEKMQEHARENGILRIVLEVRKSNEKAISLYKKCGFKDIGTRRDFYEFPREDAVIMEWN